MKLRASAATLAMIAAPLAPAVAQKLDEPVVEPAPVVMEAAPVYAWAGGYVGADLGWGWANTGSVRVFADEDEEDEADLRDIGKDGDGAYGGLFAGYLWQNGNFVYGGEAAYDWADVELDDDNGTLFSTAILKAKAGYAFDTGTLLYAVGGATYGDAKIGGDEYNDWGWTVGAGVDQFVTDTITVGAEVLYQEWDEFDNSDTDLSVTTLVARVAYHF